MPRHYLRRHPAPDADTDSPQPRANRTARDRNVGAAPTEMQFQTPPTRGTPQLHPSSGPIDSVESTAHHPAASAQAAIFSLFGRGVTGRQRMQMMDEDDEEEDEEEEEGVVEDDEEFEDQRNVDLDPEDNEVEEISDEDAHGMVGEEGEDEDEMMHDREKSPSPLPSNLREISSLASWTVSTHKPGCGVAALRNPSTSQYWQSDGPQPHTLSLHFFKLVAVVRIRVFLDFEMDESYTPTKMIFLAGMGGNDLVEFATWEGEAPCGWVDVPLEGVGGRSGGWVRRKRRRRNPRTRAGKRDTNRHSKGGGETWPDYVFDSENQIEYDEVAYEDDDDETAEDDDDDDPYAGNVLKAMVLQMRIMENHQNGKDTHVRGFQVFARDDDRRRFGHGHSASADGRIRRQSVRKSIHGVKENENDDADRSKIAGLQEPDWMGEPVIR